MHIRIRKKREEMGYSGEIFAEKPDAKRLDCMLRIDDRYLPLLDSMIADLPALRNPQSE